MRLKASEVRDDLEALGEVRALRLAPSLEFTGVSTDTRRDVQGTLYVALQGERFDGHDFVGAAVERGARGVLVRHDPGAAAAGAACFAVAEPLQALQALARASLRRHPARVIAITGSNGKTTTKDLTAAALTSLGSVHATQGNWNNHIGVPLTLLGRRGDEAFVVAEIGANDFGEIEALSGLLQPEVALITNIGRAHLQRFGSLQGVLRAKTEIFTGLRAGGLAVLNADDPFLDAMSRAASGARRVTFGFRAGADYRIESCRDDGPDGQTLVVQGSTLHLPRPGEGNARNAAAAFAVACELGATPARVAAALASCAFTAQRACWTRVGDVLVLDDSYNANPDSMAQALEVLSHHAGRRIAVLGDMGELGPGSAVLHAELGRRIASRGIHLFLATGDDMRHAVEAATALGDGARHFAGLPALLEALRQLLRPGDAILVKGSRAARMERVVEALRAEVA